MRERPRSDGDGPFAPRAASDAIAAASDSPLLLVDVDPTSPSRGRLFPVVAGTLEGDAYAPDHLLAVAPFPGIVLEARRRYAFVVRRSLGDAAGAALGVPAAVACLRAGDTPGGARGAAMRDSLASVWPTLEEVGVPIDDVAAATAFTTAGVVADVAALSSAVRERLAVDVEELALDPDDGSAHPRFCEVHGPLRLPQLQAGTPPFNRDGLFRFDADGLPIAQREESVPIAITLPRADARGRLPADALLPRLRRAVDAGGGPRPRERARRYAGTRRGAVARPRCTRIREICSSRWHRAGSTASPRIRSQTTSSPKRGLRIPASWCRCETTGSSTRITSSRGATTSSISTRASSPRSPQPAAPRCRLQRRSARPVPGSAASIGERARCARPGPLAGAVEPIRLRVAPWP